MRALEAAGLIVFLVGCAEGDFEESDGDHDCGEMDTERDAEFVEDPDVAPEQQPSVRLEVPLELRASVAVIERRMEPLPSGIALPYALGDLDVSPLPFCTPRPSCVAEVLRLTSADLTVLTYDGQRLIGPEVLREPVVIADLPRGVVLELPAGSWVEVPSPHHVKSCAKDSCQLLDLRSADVRLFETVPPS